MNRTQLDSRKKELMDKAKAEGFGWNNGRFVSLPAEYELEMEALRCIDMINSLLCYNCRHATEAREVLSSDQNSYHSYLKEYVNSLGETKVLDLIQGQINSIERIKEGVFEDDEGLLYNEIVWRPSHDDVLENERVKP